MATFIRLKNEQSQPLPAEFGEDDVRYTEGLVEHFLLAYTREGDVILDPFAGFGTTLRVAERLGRIGYGIEYDARRCEYSRARLRHPERLIHGDSRRLSSYALPPIDFSLTSPPYMGQGDPEDPLTNYRAPGGGYAAYVDGLARIYGQLAGLLRPDARAVIEVANIKNRLGVTTLAWDVARAVSAVLSFEGEIVVGWDRYGYGYDHSYCLVFGKPA